MQITGPLMAKGMEDTLMYRYFRFIGHNEVGDDLQTFGMPTADFHQRMRERQRYFPYSLNATATHDTKRGEDVRARLHLLSFMPDRWLREIRRWMAQEAGNAGDLSRAEQYFVLQTLFGAVPFSDESSFGARVKEYLVKAAREAKLQSSWDKPNERHEDALSRLAVRIADRESSVGKAMRKLLKEWEQQIIANSLAQLALKCMCPGIPDTYQGTELWDLSFVDPDNRREVDYEKRLAFLEEMAGGTTNLADLLSKGADGRVKMFVLHKLLLLRKENPDLFRQGAYKPLATNGSNRYIAFARSYKGKEVVVILPKGGWSPDQEPATLALRLEAPAKWRHIFTGEVIEKGTWELKTLLRDFPIAVLESIPIPRERAAGILLPIFSLKSDFGIGGLGQEAVAFADFLAASGQKYWQILPLNPVSKSNAYSPYAGSSTFALEPLYIDPVKLATLGLLTPQEVDNARLPMREEVDYAGARHLKQELLRKAWRRFSEGSFYKLKHEFEVFCKQHHWLRPYSLYVVAKGKYGDQAWYEWPKPLRDREPAALSELENNNPEELAYQQWLQFICAKQWQELKLYCEQLNIGLIGDLPFYMSADSADVWVNRHLFSVDDQGDCTFSAGVPPDYFNEDGQLWGMPTYDWEALEKEQYRWWIERVQRNTELYHLLRLDHFRAFYDYWEVPAGEKSAKEGKWKDGPKHKLFARMAEVLPAMPFIAEDLGDIHEAVYSFRRELKLPGMRVLQFGFENYDAASRDLPHNFVPETIAYTGTHDNNTTVGWYRDLDQHARRKLSQYAGYEVDGDNVGDALIEIAYRSVAQTVIIPLQDVLGLGESSRINTPATVEDNWVWRLVGDLDGTPPIQERLAAWVDMYNR